MQTRQFRAYKGLELLGTCPVEVSAYYAEHGYPEYYDRDDATEDYRIQDAVQALYPEATSWMMQ